MSSKEEGKFSPPGGFDPSEDPKAIERLYGVLERLEFGDINIYDAKYNLRSLLANEYYRGKKSLCCMICGFCPEAMQDFIDQRIKELKNES